MKEPLRGIRFRTVSEILQAVDRSIRTINTTGAVVKSVNPNVLKPYGPLWDCNETALNFILF